MTEWKSIAREAPQIVALADGGAGQDIAQIEVPLSGVPPFEWTEYFRAPIGVEVPTDVRPTLARDRITFALPEQRLEGYVASLDELIAQANDRYRANVVPRLDRQRAAAAELHATSTSERQSENDEKLDALRRRARDL
jgi:hypothetical protein